MAHTGFDGLFSNAVIDRFEIGHRKLKINRLDITGGIDDFTSMVWENLNKDNKVSLFVRYIEIETGRYETRIVNLHQNGESNE
jgi:hypothetical protein